MFLYPNDKTNSKKKIEIDLLFEFINTIDNIKDYYSYFMMFYISFLSAHFLSIFFATIDYLFFNYVIIFFIFVLWNYMLLKNSLKITKTMFVYLSIYLILSQQIFPEQKNYNFNFVMLLIII